MADELRPSPPRGYRWIVLVFIALTMLGNYYVYDSIAPIADLLSKQLGFSDSNIGLLQAIYSIPNIFMVVLGGYVVDRIGTRKAILIFGSLCLAGACVTVLSSKLAVMAAGRLIFGLGAESLIVAVTTAVAKWFRGKELSFAFGINLMIARAGSLLAQQSPSWAGFAYSSWRKPLIISIWFGTLCVIGAIFYWLLEIYAERHYRVGPAGSTDKVVFSDIKGFGISYWYIVALCIVFYSGIFPFETFAYKFFMDVHHVTREAGGDLVGMLTIFTMFGTPLFGLFVDRVGKRAFLMMLGSLLLIPVYLMMAYMRSASYVTVYLPSTSNGHFAFVAHHLRPILVLTMAMMGVAFSLIPAVMWPSVAYIVDQSKLGTAYGVMTMIQNIGLAGFNLLIGWANDRSGADASNPAGYHLGMWIFSILGFLGVLFAFLLRQRETSSQGHGLEAITTASSA
ncbi:MAG: major facilitator superfamily transporter [Acidobacteriaceae bacterium]|nr:major facilitator superfamily transporter [Acidobacteriaceae bacterium]